MEKWKGLLLCQSVSFKALTEYALSRSKEKVIMYKCISCDLCPCSLPRGDPSSDSPRHSNAWGHSHGMQNPGVSQRQAASMWVAWCHILLPCDWKLLQGNKRSTQWPMGREREMRDMSRGTLHITSASGVLIPLACRSLLVAWKPMMESWLLRPSVSGSSLQSSPEHPPRWWPVCCP